MVVADLLLRLWVADVFYARRHAAVLGAHGGA